MEKQVKLSDLPSRGLVYGMPEDTVITLRSMIGEDESILASSTLANFEKKLLLLLQRTVKGIDAKLLTVGDRLAIVLWLVIHSYSKNTEVEFVCPKCFSNQLCNVDLSLIPTKPLAEDYKEPQTRTLESGELLKLRLLRVEDEIRVEEHEKFGDTWLYRYALTIVTGDDLLKNIEKIKNLPTQDVAKIRAFQEKYSHGPTMTTDVKCGNCQEVLPLQVPFRPEMLLPTGEELTKYFGDAV